jgi:hypothetical protein
MEYRNISEIFKIHISEISKRIIITHYHIDYGIIGYVCWLT